MSAKQVLVVCINGDLSKVLVQLVMGHWSLVRQDNDIGQVILEWLHTEKGMMVMWAGSR